ncbi:cytochrome P450 [Lentzea sp. NPDC005914]|uniref:cytochrome P450 n=1 Tax=Lentzea sp. NPDC005914 TaxID=3154572 RepID=UPI003409C192
MIRAWRFRLDPLPLLDSCIGAGSLALGADQELVWEPSRVGEIFRTEHQMRVDGSSTLEPLVGKHSLLFANGPAHTSHRQVIGPQLRGRALAAWQPVIAAETAAALAPGVVDLPSWTRKLTLRIISRILFGETRDEFLSSFAAWVDSALGNRRRALVYRYLRFSSVPAWRNFLREREELRRLVLSFPSGLDVGDLSDSDRADQLVSLLFAGHETTASALTSALYWLDRSPGVLADLRDEPDGPLLDAVCREVLRISPPAVIAGNRVLEGKRLTPCIYAAHRNPEVFTRPLEFCPERFVGHRFPASQYLPFGGGTRRCLGADLAMLELRTVLAMVVQTDFRVVAPERAVFGPRGQVLCFPELTAAFRRPAPRG